MTEFDNFSEVLKVLISGGEEGFTAENFSAAALRIDETESKFYQKDKIAKHFADAMTKEGPPEFVEEEEGEE